MRLKPGSGPILLAVLFGIITLGDCHQKVRLENVKTLTLHDGQLTAGRRSAGVPQLSCVGGGARGAFRPRTVQCTNTGHDGIDFQWKCSAELPHDYEFGKITVVCEGFDHPDDPYILAGSCGLEYNLEYTADGKSSRDSYGIKKQGGPSFWDNVIPFIVICFIIFVIYVTCSGNAPGQPVPRGGGPGYPPGSGPGYPPSGPPPPYDDYRGSKPSHSQATPNEGAGFWTGAGLGALGGYVFGRNQAQGPSTSRQGETQFARDTGFRQSPPPQSTSTDTRESTGYGGTRRR